MRVMSCHACAAAIKPTQLIYLDHRGAIMEMLARNMRIDTWYPFVDEADLGCMWEHSGKAKTCNRCGYSRLPGSAMVVFGNIRGMPRCWKLVFRCRRCTEADL